MYDSTMDSLFMYQIVNYKHIIMRERLVENESKKMFKITNNILLFECV